MKQAVKPGQWLNCRKNEILIANVVMSIVALFWGVSFISIKIAVSEIPPVTMALLRFTMASLLLWVAMRRLEPDASLARSDIPRMVLGGIFGITLYFYFENMGVRLSTAANASLIVALVPIITIGLDVLVFRSRISAVKLCGVFIGIAGSYLSVTANGELDFNSTNFQGNLLIVGAMLSWAVYTLLNKSLQGRYSGVVLTTYQTFFGTLCLIPLSLTEYKDWQPFSLLALCHVVFLAVFCSVICYVLYIYVLKRLDVAITTLYLNVIPVVGVVSGYLVLGERVFPSQLVGGLLTLLAILLANLEQRKTLARAAR
ncbi:putative membrane protein [Propionispora sp. 2/2-37]|uniref:DMT family transporter n=1 Tax=Propionispora sp. 2/2-37 TaxID=1677858 RepID=UPI0006BB84A7|nr:DMT family transporter [Propionispora sp. 2/2-37]CUH96556.1 putative membrane protein [Propionispora sp. 2/2-37]